MKRFFHLHACLSPYDSIGRAVRPDIPTFIFHSISEKCKRFTAPDNNPASDRTAGSGRTFSIPPRSRQCYFLFHRYLHKIIQPCQHLISHHPQSSPFFLLTQTSSFDNRYFTLANVAVEQSLISKPNRQNPGNRQQAGAPRRRRSCRVFHDPMFRSAGFGSRLAFSLRTRPGT